MNKKAFLMPEFLKIILAVMCILGLVLMATKLYGILDRRTQMEQAKGSLKEMVAEINSLKNLNDVGDYLYTAPKGWTLFMFKKDQIGQSSCMGKTCLCLCPKSDAESCPNEGVCENLNLEFSSSTRDSFVFSYIPQRIFFRIVSEANNQKIKIYPPISQTEFIDNFLKKEIEFNGKTMKINDFVISELFLSCMKFESNAVDENARRKVQLMANEYLEELEKAESIPPKNKNGDLSSQLVFIAISEGKIVLTAKSNGDFSKGRVSEKKDMCTGEVNAYAEFLMR